MEIVVILAFVLFMTSAIITKFYPNLHKTRPKLVKYVLILYLITIILGLIANLYTSYMVDK
jgi:uncharacterized membrane protein (DUF106 family)